MTRASNHLTSDEMIALGEEMHAGNVVFGDQADLDGPDWLAILVEEVGEVARELNEATLRGAPEIDLLLAELLQVAAVAMRWRAVVGRASVG